MNIQMHGKYFNFNKITNIMKKKFILFLNNNKNLLN